MEKFSRIAAVFSSVYHRFRDGKEEPLDEEILALIAERAARRKAAIKEREKSIAKARNRRCLTTINVSGQRFIVDKAIFSRFPGKIQLVYFNLVIVYLHSIPLM
jgi:hypothetical protein